MNFNAIRSSMPFQKIRDCILKTSNMRRNCYSCKGEYNVPKICGIDPTKNKPPYSFENILPFHHLKRIGPRQTEIAKAYANSVFCYLTFFIITLFYFTDWKVVVTKIPIYGSQFPPPEQPT